MRLETPATRQAGVTRYPKGRSPLHGNRLGGLILLGMIGLWLGCAGPKQVSKTTTETIHIDLRAQDSVSSKSPSARPGDGSQSGQKSESSRGKLGGNGVLANTKPGEDSASKMAANRGKLDGKKTGSTKRKSKSDGPKNTEPLIMENADRLEGFRTRGEYILTGRVRFRHGDLRFETERAVWSKEQNQVYCEQGMKLTHHGAELISDRGNYSKARSEAEAEGHVTFRDSSGQIRGKGNRLTYNRLSHDIFFTGAPEIRRIYFDSIPGKKGGLDTSRPTDTLLLRARRMQYNDSTEIAFAESTVIITKRKTHITCHRAEYRDKVDSLFLMGDPKVHVDRSEIQGDRIKLLVDGENILGLMVEGKAQALNLDPKTDSTPERKSEVRGDSLQIAFTGKNIDSVQVFRNTEGLYFDTPKPALKNRMQGNHMVMHFKGKEVQSAKVLGAAKSTYYHLEKGELRGRNVAQGDSIRFAFSQGQVEEVLVTGNARGFYFGRNKPKRTDSTAIADSAKSRMDSNPMKSDSNKVLPK